MIFENSDIFFQIKILEKNHIFYKKNFKNVLIIITNFFIFKN